MFLDELTSRLDFVAHQDAEHFIRFGSVGHTDLDQATIFGIQGRFTKFLGVHFTQSFKAGYLKAFFSSCPDGCQQASKIFQSHILHKKGVFSTDARHGEA